MKKDENALSTITVCVSYEPRSWSLAIDQAGRLDEAPALGTFSTRLHRCTAAGRLAGGFGSPLGSGEKVLSKEPGVPACKLRDGVGEWGGGQNLFPEDLSAAQLRAPRTVAEVNR